MKTTRRKIHFIAVLAMALLLTTGCATVDTNNVDLRPWNRPSQEEIWANWRAADSCDALRAGKEGHADPTPMVWIGYCLIWWLVAVCKGCTR